MPQRTTARTPSTSTWLPRIDGRGITGPGARALLVLTRSRRGVVRATLAALTALTFSLHASPAHAVERAAAVEGRPLLVISAGDSITWGGPPAARERTPYPAALDRLCGTACTVENVGHPGACLLLEGCYYPVRIRDTLRSEVWNQHPDVVIVGIGTNDLIGHPTLASYRREIRAIQADGARHGSRVVVATIPPGRVYPTDTENLRQSINAWIRTVGHVDFDAALVNNGHLLRRRYDSGDGLHPNSAGYRSMAREAWRVLSK